MIETITINNLIMGTVDSGYYFTSISGFGFPEIEIDVKSRGSWHGSRLNGYRYDRRVVNIELEIWGTSKADFETKRYELEKALRIHNGLTTVYFTTKSGVALQFDAILSSKLGETYQKGKIITCEARIELVAPYPFFESQLQENIEVNIFEGGGFAIPFGIPLDMSTGGSETTVYIDNDGNGIVYPVIRFYGIIENPTLTNMDTNESISATYSLTDGADYIEIDTYNRTATLNSSTNVKQYVTGDWLKLESGSNPIKLTASSYGTGAKAIVIYRHAYLGI